MHELENLSTTLFQNKNVKRKVCHWIIINKTFNPVLTNEDKCNNANNAMNMP